MLLKCFYADSCQITRLFYCSIKLAGVCRRHLKNDTIWYYAGPVLIISPDDVEVLGEAVPYPVMKMHF